MTTLNKVKTSVALETPENDDITIIQKLKQIPAIYKLGIIVLQTAINIILLVFLFLPTSNETLVVKDTVVPVQYIKNIEFISSVLVNAQLKERIKKAYGKLYVGLSLYIYHVLRLNRELQHYMRGTQDETLEWSQSDHDAQTKHLLSKVKGYDDPEKNNIMEETFNALDDELSKNEVELTAVYSAQGYKPYGILNFFAFREEKLKGHKCRLLALTPKEGDRIVYKKMEQYFNTLFKDPYVKEAILFLHKMVEMHIQYESEE